MKSQPKQKLKTTLGELRTGLLAAIAELDLKGTDSKVTQAMCIIEEAFSSAASGRKVIPRQTFLSGMAKAKAAELVAGQI
jgi:hypothetical protein